MTFYENLTNCVVADTRSRTDGIGIDVTLSFYTSQTTP